MPYESPFEGQGSVWFKIARIGAGITGLAGSYYFGISFILPFVAAGLGIFAGSWIAKRADVDGNAIKYLSWVNLVAWLIPFAGMFIGSAYFVFSNTSTAHKLQYRILSIGGVIFAFINMAVAIWMTMNGIAH